MNADKVLERMMLKKFGINVQELSKTKVISNEACFFSLLQSYTDRLYFYYQEQESSLRYSYTNLEKSLKLFPVPTKKRSTRNSPLSAKISKRSSLNLASRSSSHKLKFSSKRMSLDLSRKSDCFDTSRENTFLSSILGEFSALKEELVALDCFLESNRSAYKQILEAYGKLHKVDIYNEELEELMQTHKFWDGAKLRDLISSIDVYTEQYQGGKCSSINRTSKRDSSFDLETELKNLRTNAGIKRFKARKEKETKPKKKSMLLCVVTKLWESKENSCSV